MNAYVEVAAVSGLVIYVVDLSGFTATWKGWLGSWLGGVRIGAVPPFDCSLCMVWWCGIVWTLCRGCLSLPMLCWVALLSYLSAPVGTLVAVLRDCLVAALAAFERRINGVK